MNSINVYRFAKDDKEKIISIIKSEIENYEDILFAYLYGSLVDHEMPFVRDIDIGIYVSDMEKAKRWNYEVRIINDIEKRLKDEGFYIPVDVKVINMSDVLYVHDVIRGRLLFVKDESLWADFVVEVSKKYNDFYPLWDHFMKEALSP
ncbi:MAG: hypothetical protein A3I04_04085 [Nitrospinae bacterium RIFCSPLOWO2_02_FULL_39_110]|nr:MAG: hypothetical protein A2W53_06190 [Nitrospinae bacterium RIFCSPHIGHO2_02_39_11]OGW00138.1 MAG: hypothetical protein A3D97_00505 [Nitrospinae bacterium RIFCSPHIGHO2_12_FULL_39_42]OGW00321.1 MAG: hypothetical protein A3D20_02865 [Nitrospinae bacterium RIFCSPHIGHO2_02_FULL_39_82]OGW02471.1 MAG: hypothetical protein A2Z59_10335 [Nitrospinae bacterium RIFCSPLOWO2_02_39_17]OGW07103.1 MAG: hypothetical protein A3I04_04085 [Nitrospinae bacterium RIFCSPLOWO2_02_FULL_39_110]OGW11858.1 MAG: hypoth